MGLLQRKRPHFFLFLRLFFFYFKFTSNHSPSLQRSDELLFFDNLTFTGPLSQWIDTNSSLGDNGSERCLPSSRSSVFLQNQSSGILTTHTFLSFSLFSQKSAGRFSDRQRLLRLLPRRLKEDGLSRRPYLLCRLRTLR